MGSIGFNICGHNALPMKNDNWHKFQTQLPTKTKLITLVGKQG